MNNNTNNLEARMPRYCMDIAGGHNGYSRDMDFTQKKSSLGYNTAQYVPYFQVSRYHSLEDMDWHARMSFLWRVNFHKS